LIVACRTVDGRFLGSVRSWLQRRVWKAVRLTSGAAICGIQLSHVGGLHSAGVVRWERVLRRRPPMRPQREAVVILEVMNLRDQLIAQGGGRFYGEHWLGLPRLVDRTIGRFATVLTAKA
jgi:hypothetical protein